MIYKKVKDLNTSVDRSVWISDDRISASLCAQGNGIGQIDYHGIQPVSRNAKFLASATGVLRFRFFLQDSWRGFDFTMHNLRVYPFGVQSFHRFADASLCLQVCVYRDRLTARCNVRFPTKVSKAAGFEVIWDGRSMATDVHGLRSWSDPEQVNANQLQLHANDRIFLNAWLQRRGDYKGDFLIPEGWRRLIFKRRCISGTARKSDLYPQYRNHSFLLYDADTWIVLGNEHLKLSQPEDAVYAFTQRAEINKSWISRPFTLQFYSQKPPHTPLQRFKPKSFFHYQSQRYRQKETHLPRLSCPAWPGIEAFFNQYPLIVESAWVQDVDMTRACPGTYYWIWAWDNLVTLQSMFFWREYKQIKSMIDFMRTHRDIDGALPMRWSRHLEPMDSRGIGAIDFLFANAVMRLFDETADRRVLYANYTTLVHAFRQMVDKADNNGFFPSIGMYPDLPQKMGRHESSLVCIDQGAFYCFCRLLIRAAQELGDDRTAQQARLLQMRIEAHFFDFFWDKDKGFFCDSYDLVQKRAIKSYPLFSLLFLESDMGDRLLRGKETRVARFIAEHSLTPYGLRLTPDWDIFHHTEPAMSSWYPHWDFPVLRLLGKAGEFKSIAKWLDLVESCFQRLGYCPEFIAAKKPFASIHGAAWNLNCGSGWYNALLRALVGMDFGADGITLLATPYSCRLSNIAFRSGLWSKESLGEGKHVAHFWVDGKKINYVLKIPSIFYTPGTHRLQVQYQTVPVLHALLHEIDAEVISVQKKEKTIRYRVKGDGPVKAVFSGSVKNITLDDKQLQISSFTNARWWVQFDLSGEHQLDIQEQR